VPDIKVEAGPLPQPSAAPASPIVESDNRRHGMHEWRRAAGFLSVRNVSAIYVFALIFIVFSLWVPHTFLDWGTWRAMISTQALTALLAVGLVIALSAGAFDLAIGATLGFGEILVAWLLVKHGVAIVPAVALSTLAGAAVGLANGLLVVRARIDSFIATLGVSSVLLALTSWISASQQIVGLSNGFQNIATNKVLGFPMSVYVMVVVAFAVWYILERTPIGRRVYATGGNIEAARLAGVKTSVVIVGALIACGAIAAFSGVLVTSSLGAGDPTIGPPYLLPAFSAAFLGSTQFHGGRFNVWGTVLAVYVLGTGVMGLQLAGAPIWIPELFNGLALLLAVGLSKYQRTARRTSAIRRLIGTDKREAAARAVDPQRQMQGDDS
jgi:ribose transport system permease protein